MLREDMIYSIRVKALEAKGKIGLGRIYNCSSIKFSFNAIKTGLENAPCLAMGNILIPIFECETEDIKSLYALLEKL